MPHPIRALALVMVVDITNDPLVLDTVGGGKLPLRVSESPESKARTVCSFKTELELERTAAVYEAVDFDTSYNPSDTSLRDGKSPSYATVHAGSSAEIGLKTASALSLDHPPPPASSYSRFWSRTDSYLPNEKGSEADDIVAQMSAPDRRRLYERRSSRVAQPPAFSTSFYLPTHQNAFPTVALGPQVCGLPPQPAARSFSEQRSVTLTFLGKRLDEVAVREVKEF